MPAFSLRVYQRALPQTVVTTSSCSLLLICRPKRMKGWVGLVGWPIADRWFTHKWSPVGCRSSAGQQKLADKRTTFYRWATEPTTHIKRIYTVVMRKRVFYSFILWTYVWNSYGTKYTVLAFYHLFSPLPFSSFRCIPVLPSFNWHQTDNCRQTVLYNYDT